MATNFPRCSSSLTVGKNVKRSSIDSNYSTPSHQSSCQERRYSISSQRLATNHEFLRKVNDLNLKCDNSRRRRSCSYDRNRVNRPSFYERSKSISYLPEARQNLKNIEHFIAKDDILQINNGWIEPSNKSFEDKKGLGKFFKVQEVNTIFKGLILSKTADTQIFDNMEFSWKVPKSISSKNSQASHVNDNGEFSCWRIIARSA